ncbi:hypothetical protein C8J56DRAFT_1060597 [Mycena floridula]|nr:hypothetical protein C8J56DRAFT_1060597 [Mycena floridula]
MAEDEEMQAPPAGLGNHLRSANFYKADGNVILLVEYILFKLHLSMLTDNSVTFEAILNVNLDPSNGGLPKAGTEGSSDEHPIILPPNVTLESWITFLTFIYRLHHIPLPHTYQYLYNLLSIASFLQADEIRQYAIKNIIAIPEAQLSIPHLLPLIIDFSIYEWIPFVVKKLWEKPAADIIPADRALIDHRTAGIFANAQLALWKRTRMLAFIPQAINAGYDLKECDAEYHREFCQMEWRAEWQYHVPNALLKPMYPSDPFDLLSLLEFDMEHRKMRPACKALKIAEMRKNWHDDDQLKELDSDGIVKSGVMMMQFRYFIERQVLVEVDKHIRDCTT